MRMSADLERGFCGSAWSEEYDVVPLRLRLNMLRRTQNPDLSNVAAAVSESDETCKSRCVKSLLLYFEKPFLYCVPLISGGSMQA